MATQRDYYDILGVPRGAGDDEIKKSFRKLAQQWHPDVNTSTEADVRFKEINEAYQVLSDPQRRQAYDMFGHAATGAAAGGGFDPFGTGGSASGGGFQGFGDLFDTLFGAASGGARRPRVPTGADLRYDLRLTFAESINGAEKEIDFGSLARCDTCSGSGAEPGTSPTTCLKCTGTGELRNVRQTMLGQMVSVTPCDRCHGTGKIVESPCHTCHGEGRVERRRKLRVTVPAGIDDGHQIRLSGEGEAAPRGGVPGNLYVVAHVAAHPELRRQETELFYDLSLSITQAALGARIRVPTADAEEEVEIKPGTQAGTEIRLRGKGVPHLRRQGSRGDVHVLVDVHVPNRLTARQRALLEELAGEFGEVDDEPEATGASEAGAGSGGQTDAPTGAAPSKRARRRAHKNGIRDRIRDVIS
ncbi:MAG TPA: molecular chaperone DnaJ [Candidatus Limnocylindrales bacterium]|nr:molecular chaperone DnaJ [Candidatus Limnocylindrales bacterium]